MQGGCSPVFDQLHQRLAAAAQPLAFLEFVEQGHGLAWQLEQHLFSTGSTKALAVEFGSVGCGGGFRHRRTWKQFTRNASVQLNGPAVHCFVSDPSLVTENFAFPKKSRD